MPAMMVRTDEYRYEFQAQNIVLRVPLVSLRRR